MAEWLAQHMRSLGLDNVQVMETAGHPVVYGEWLGAGPSRPTVLVYGHYDVVPAEMADGWETDPFAPVVKDGRIYARGATDDKGQLFTWAKALEAYLQTDGAAPVNVKFLLEGEEEVASPNLRPFLEANLELLRADVCVISDSSMARIDEPAITHSLRGMTYLEIAVRGRVRICTVASGAARPTTRPWRWWKSWASSTTRTAPSPCPASTTTWWRSPTTSGP
ncbi:MAG: M20/M25/M40 family metallo-hydrolase [Caldilineaceae bacterium]